MKLNIVVLLMTLLVGCKSAERALVCSEADRNALGEQLICHSSIRFNFCECKKINLDTFTEITDFEDYPFEYCDGLVGFKADVWGEDLGPKFKSLTRLKETRCGN